MTLTMKNHLQKSRQLIVVSGMHRSGTSALAQLFVEAGFEPGNNLMPADRYNPNGYFEDMDIFRLNNKLLSYLFLSWDSVEEICSRRILLYQQQLIALFAVEAEALLSNKLEQSEKVLVKDPRFSILLPFWNAVFNRLEAEVSNYHIIRSPLSVAKSLQKRNNFSIRNGLLLWYFYNMAFLNDIRKPVSVIRYEELIAKPEGILSNLEQKDNIKAGNRKLSKDVIVPELNHHPENKDDLEQASRFCPEIQAIWNDLKRGSFIRNVPAKNDLVHQHLATGITGLWENNAAVSCTFNLLMPSQGENQPQVISGQTYSSKTGQVTFVVDEPVANDRFILYTGDQPCRVKIKNTSVVTPHGNIDVRPSGGNYVLLHNNEYFFTDNQPELEYHLQSTTSIEKIQFDIEVNTLQNSDLQIIIPALSIKILEGKKQESTFLKEIQKPESIDGQPREKIKKQQQEIDNLIQNKNVLEAEIELLEKKSLWLFTEFNKLKASSSWKVTAPLRWIQNVGIKIQNRSLILVNDVGASYRLLRREGIGKFLYRLMWYLRGKRLKEEIENRRLTNCNDLEEAHDYLDDAAEKQVFAKHNAPLVSIIIPVYNQFEITRRCLVSLHQNTGDIPVEIILVDDQSSDNTTRIEDFFEGIVVIRNQRNLGFLKSCNEGAKHARGKYICLLNNDTKVHAGWLDKLVETLDNHHAAAIAGPKLVYPDGRLQEAGGIIWDDASGWNYGKYDEADKPDYNYLKEVDYVSGACLLIRKNIWEELNGFDERFAPAYFEDTDLAFRARQAGYKVLYQPAAVVTHCEGLSNGKNEHLGVKKYQAINRKKFSQKWDHVLKVESSPNGINVFFHRDRSLRQKHLLVIDHYVPMYDHDAGSRSTFGYLKLLVKMGFKIHFIGDNYFKHEPYATTLEQMGIEVLYGNYYQKNIRDWFHQNGRYIDFVIAHRVHIAPKYFGMIKKFTSAKIAYVGHDLQYLGSRRKFDLTGDKKFKKESAKFLKAETQIFNTVDIILPFSTFEEPYIRKMAPEKTVQVIPVYFFDSAPEKVPGFDERRDILFVGYFGHPPNPDAIKWFAQEIFPLVQQKVPDAKLHVVGSQPTDEVLGLHSDSIKVTGYVSDEELANYYRKCKVAILPLRFGAGVKGKLLESLNHQIPTVISPVAAEGVPEIEQHSLVAETPNDFAEKIMLLYQDKNMWEKYAARGKELIEKHYTEAVAKKLLEEIFTHDSIQELKH
jgi:GT2 family glycosyltransferase